MTIVSLNMILSLVLFSLSLVVPLLVMLFAGERFDYTALPQLLLSYSLFFNVGCLFLAGFLGQLLYSHEIAATLGWQWSQFQHELGFSELSLAVLGLISPLFHKEFWAATIIATVIWLLGGAGVHIYNGAVLNTRFIIGWNIFIALWLIALYCYYVRAKTTDLPV